MIHRKISEKLKSRLMETTGQSSVLLVEGARQVGKTTLIRQVLAELAQDFIEINLEEDPNLVAQIQACKNFSEWTDLLQIECNFKPNRGKILFIDEAQESSQLGKFVRFMKEKWPETQTVLSGSSMQRLFRSDTRYPVGRVEHWVVAPFSFEEFLLAGHQTSLLEYLAKASFKNPPSPIVHQKLTESFENYLQVGGMPEVVLHFFSKKDWEKNLENLYYAYLRDFSRIYGEEKVAYFEACLKTTAALLGSPFKNTQVSQFLDGGKNAWIIEALSQLELWRMLIKSDQKGGKASNQFHPKRYLFDHGLAKRLREMALPKLSFSKLMGKETLGGLLENMVAIELFRQNPLSPLVGYKKSSSGTEIDFMFKLKEATLPLEVKSVAQVKKTHLKGLKGYLEMGLSPLGIVISLSPLETFHLNKKTKIYNIPFYLLERLDALTQTLIS